LPDSGRSAFAADGRLGSCRAPGALRRNAAEFDEATEAMVEIGAR